MDEIPGMFVPNEENRRIKVDFYTTNTTGNSLDESNFDEIKNNSVTNKLKEPEIIINTTFLNNNSNSTSIKDIKDTINELINLTDLHSNSHDYNSDEAVLINFYNKIIDFSNSLIIKHNSSINKTLNQSMIDSTQFNHDLKKIELLDFMERINMKSNNLDILIKEEEKINKDTINKSNEKEQNAFHIACKNGCSLDFMQFLKKLGVDYRVKDIYGRSLLHYSVEYCSDQVCNFFIENGLKVSEKDNDEKTMLHFACLYKPLETVNKYLKIYMEEIDNKEGTKEEIIIAFMQNKQLLIGTNKTYSYYDEQYVLNKISKV